MKQLPSNKFLMKKYRLTEEQLFSIMHSCVSYFLSEDELEEFIYEYYHKLEMRLNKRYQR